MEDMELNDDFTFPLYLLNILYAMSKKGIFRKTRMHSSRMRTIHPLTIVPVCILGGGRGEVNDLSFLGVWQGGQ